MRCERGEMGEWRDEREKKKKRYYFVVFFGDSGAKVSNLVRNENTHF